MGLDAMANDAPAAPAIAREIGKKKRQNRSAKLKQCKLDARREQFLSQVKNKGFKDTSPGTSPSSHPEPIPDGRSAERELRRQLAAPALESSDADSPTHHLDVPPSRKERPINNSISSGGSSIGSCSRSVSDAEDDTEEGGGLDDWETVADALSVSPNNNHDLHPITVTDATSATAKTNEPIRREPEQAIPRAWRSDDVFRPQSLPNLSKQRSFLVNHNHHGILSSPPPSSCPICYEDLDFTDSSFLPCDCGFRLCLFCHKRILEDDGRCPGCRKQYNPMVTEAWVVPPLSYRLSRSYSLSPRY